MVDTSTLKEEELPYPSISRELAFSNFCMQEESSDKFEYQQKFAALYKLWILDEVSLL